MAVAFLVLTSDHVFFVWQGYFERELNKEHIVLDPELGVDPEAPAPRDMVDLEVSLQLKLKH